MKKILFSDLDGTIVEGDVPITSKDCKAVQELRKSGHLFAICTGRNEQETSLILPYFEYDYMILNNGAMIMDNQGHRIYRQTISNQHAKEIFAYCREHYPYLNYTFYAGKETYGYFPSDKQSKRLTASGYVNIEEDFWDLFYQEEDDFDILCCWNEDGGTDEILHIQQFIKENYPGIHGTQNTCFLDITADHCSKGTGVLKLCELLGEELETYCIGDSYNDFSQFEVAHHAYTFHRVNDDIKAKTEKQVDYVYELINDMLGGMKNVMEK